MDEVIRLFNDSRIRYLVIGGQAMRLEGMPRFSMDWDVFVPNDRANLEQINALLGDELDLPLIPLGPQGENFVQTYQTQWGVLQFHLGGPGLPSFSESEKRGVIRENENGTPIRCMCTEDLLSSKRAANRPTDQADIRFLEAKLAR